MNADSLQILYEEVIFYDIFKVFNDETRTYIATTHIPDVAIIFCEQHPDCVIERNYSTARLQDLENEYAQIRDDEE